MPRSLIAACLAALAAACTTSEERPVPGGDAEYAISCGYLNWIYCYERANELCPAGYRTLSQSEGYGPKEMRVACRPAHK